MLINFDWRHLLIGIGILIVFLPILWWRTHNLATLLFFAIFWVYLLAVVRVIFFPFAINTDYGSTTFKPNINLIPFYFGSCFVSKLCILDIIENVVITLPFGFGINFLVRVKPRSIFWIAISVGFASELSQLIISIAFRSGFRTADITDVITNAIGVMLGYVFFRAFAWAYVKAAGYFGIQHKGLLEDIYNIATQKQSAGKSKTA